jgi:hypothetical protein
LEWRCSDTILLLTKEDVAGVLGWRRWIGLKEEGMDAVVITVGHREFGGISIGGDCRVDELREARSWWM